MRELAIPNKATNINEVVPVVKTEIMVNVMPMIVQMRKAICCDTNLGIEMIPII
ncbi:hypothetical protein D3C71_1267750 [compost metagenome]